MTPDIDRLLRRKLYLQRYVTSLFNDIREASSANDRKIVQALSTFVLEADDKRLAALSRQRTSDPAVRALLSDLRTLSSEQQMATAALFAEQMPELIEQEARVTAEAIEAEPPSLIGVLTLPIAGLLLGTHLASAYNRYTRRLLSDVVVAAGTNPQAIAQIVRGRRAENFRDGLLYWRDNRVIRPTVDQLVNGTAENAAVHTYQSAGIDKVNFVSTLDYRACVSCVSADAGSPYETGKAPTIPQHPGCRCRTVPYVPNARPERPFVKDARSVKDIPVDERDGKIGQTRDTIEQFFSRMSDADRIAYMGPSRAALWNAGKIDNVRDLVNARTLRPLRLDELPTL